MRRSKRRGNNSGLIFRKSNKDGNPRCSEHVTDELKNAGRNHRSLIVSYKTICKSSKCIIHGRNMQPKIKTAKLKFRRKAKFFKNMLARKKSLKLNLFNKSCEVDEFDDFGNNFEDIDKEMFTKIEAAVEDSNLGKQLIIENIVGYGMLKDVINRTIIWPLKKPEVFRGLRTAPKGILLFGPPGTGKSSLGKFIALETNSTFFNISPSTLTSKWLGDSEKLVRTMFVVAKARQPSVIFLDEVDSILSQRIADENGFIRRMKNEFLICMDGGNTTSPEDRVLVIGATNRPHELDEAARRRFFKRFYIPLPDKLARKDILLKLLERECHSLEDIDVNGIVDRTEGYSLADLKNLSQEAAMGPIKPLSGRAFRRLQPQDIRPISMEDFLFALQLIKPTVSQEQVQSYEIWDSMYGYGGEDWSRARSHKMMVRRNTFWIILIFYDFFARHCLSAYIRHIFYLFTFCTINLEILFVKVIQNHNPGKDLSKNYYSEHKSSLFYKLKNNKLNSLKSGKEINQLMMESQQEGKVVQ